MQENRLVELFEMDERGCNYAMCQLKTKNIVTKLISEINFMSPGYQGDVIEIGVDVNQLEEVR
jgi:acyl-CoA hydrolase